MAKPVSPSSVPSESSSDEESPMTINDDVNNAVGKIVKFHPTEKIDDDERKDGDYEDVEVFLHARKLKNMANGETLLQPVVVFQISELFQTTEPERYFFWTKNVSAGSYQFGLYQTGPFTPLPFGVSTIYRVVKFTGHNSRIKISNAVENHKLYLKVKTGQKKVKVSSTFTEKSYFHMESIDPPVHETWIIHSNTLDGYALKFDNNLVKVVLALYQPNDTDFYFTLHSHPPPNQSYSFIVDV